MNNHTYATAVMYPRTLEFEMTASSEAKKQGVAFPGSAAFHPCKRPWMVLPIVRQMPRNIARTRGPMNVRLTQRITMPKPLIEGLSPCLLHRTDMVVAVGK